MFGFDFKYMEKCFDLFFSLFNKTVDMTDVLDDRSREIIQFDGGTIPSNPTTFEQAVEFVAVNTAPREIDDPFFHFTGGMNFRNRLNLWDRNSPLHQHMLQRFGLGHADDTGGLIFGAANALNNGITFDIQAEVERYKAHWRRMGIDPATQEQIGPPVNNFTIRMNQDGSFDYV